MARIETLQAMLERRLIGQMVRALEDADEQQRERRLSALRDLVQHADQSLDARLFDEWTEDRLRRYGLWEWDRAVDDARPQWLH